MLGIKSQIQLKHLKLNVWRNQITKKSSVMIGQCLKYLVNLEYLNLNLYANKIFPIGINQLADNIIQLQNLEGLFINIMDNQGSGEAAINLLKSML